MARLSGQQWIWQAKQWQNFSWREPEVVPLLRRLHHLSGLLLGKSTANSQQQQSLDSMLQNLIASSAIEGERLNVDSVRSSLARQFELNDDNPYPTSKRSDGLAEMMRDALHNFTQPLTCKRLFQWHRWLFPDGGGEFSSRPLLVGQLRGDEPMQVVSGSLTKQTVHFEAPPRSVLEQELQYFIDWFNRTAADPSLDPWLRAAITHLWFVTLHPFDDGNGRLVRALTDMALAQADNQSIRLYAMSVAILNDRKGYYDALEKNQSVDKPDPSFDAIQDQISTAVDAENNHSLDITHWVVWFLKTLEVSINDAISTIDKTLFKTRFWQRHQNDQLSGEQRKVLNILLDNGSDYSEGSNSSELSAAQYQKLAGVSKATATRHLQDLVNKRCLEKLPGGGRSTRYQLPFAG